MPLTAGTRLGPYEILSPLGVGGMGEVYLARDTRLQRNVAVKILPASLSTDLDRLRRFESEAKVLSALNHPNLLSVFDVGAQDGLHFLVSELLEGETLREKLNEGKIPQRKAAAYAIQIAHGLAAAHEKGFVHRDLKPENIFITKDGRAKILDFGLAKQEAPHQFADVTATSPTTPFTEAGAVLGTVGYMSPEQVRGRAVDARSDIFSFGAILYEMMTGQRAFHGDSAVETMSAILKEDPPEISASDPNASSSMDKLVHRCLEKNPEERFQSARDLGFALEALSGSSKASGTLSAIAAPDTATSQATPAASNKISPATIALGLIALAAIAAAAWLYHQPAAILSPAVQRLTFQKGMVYCARFNPGGETMIYDAHWADSPRQVFSTRTGTHESHPLATETGLAGVSEKGLMAVIVHPQFLDRQEDIGTLATMSVDGGSPREVLDQVVSADISRDGSEFAVVHLVNGAPQLEYPIGHILYRPATGYLSDPRISPDGSMVAFNEHPRPLDDRGFVTLVTRDGKTRRLSGEWATLRGLVWTHSGSEVWFSGARENNVREMRAVTPEGKERLVWRTPASLDVQDIASDGRVLLDSKTEKFSVMVSRPGHPDHDYSWLDLGTQALIPNDGQSVIFTEAGLGADYSVIMRNLDGSPPVPLGPGLNSSISNDGKWVLSQMPSSPTKLQLLPTGTGTARSIDLTPLIAVDIQSAWTPDDRGFYFVASEPGRLRRTYRLLLDNLKPEPVTPEGLAGSLISQDGKKLIVRDAQNNPLIYDLATKTSSQIKGIQSNDQILNWDQTGAGIYLTNSIDFPLQIDHLNVSTGARQPWRTIVGDSAGVRQVTAALPRSGSPIVYSARQFQSQLYVVTGLH